MSENDNQVGGDHYKGKVQHWDFCYEHEYDIFQVYITKYVHRHKNKNGLEDLYKAKHCLEKYIEILRQKELDTTEDPKSKGYVDQD